MSTAALEAEVKERRRALNQFQAGEHVTDDLYRNLIKGHADHKDPIGELDLCPICAETH